MAPGELDPLNRRLCAEKKPDVVVQVVILAEDIEIRNKLAEHDLMVQTVDEVAPIEVDYPIFFLKNNLWGCGNFRFNQLEFYHICTLIWVEIRN